MAKTTKMKTSSKPIEDGSVRQIMTIAFPMLVSSACETILIFTDRLFLSKVDPIHLNASLTGGMFVFTMMTFFIGLTGYITALAGQYFGANQKKLCAVALTQAVIIALTAYPLLIAARPLAHEFFSLMGIGKEQLEAQILYFDTLMWIAIFSMLRHCLSSFFAAIGRTRIVMVSSFFMMAVNVFLNYILVFGKFGFPKLGIVGAAYGSIIAAFISVVILAAGYFSPAIVKEFQIKSSFYFSKEVMGKLLRYGYPAGLEFFLNMVAFTTAIMVFQSVSPVVATAITIMINWDIVSYVPLMGIEVGVTSLAGRFMGMQRPDLAHRTAMSGIKFGCCYTGVIFVMFLGFPALLVGLFTPPEASNIFEGARPIAADMLRMACLYVFAQTIMVSLIGALRGAGDTLWAMILSVGLHFSLVPVLFVMLKILNQSPQLSWFSVIIVFYIFIYLIIRRFRLGHWKTLHVIQP